jgi:Dyp-type peroxidase family
MQVRDAAAARGWLGGLVASDPPAITTAAPYTARPAVARNVALSAAGLSALRVDEQLIATFADEFLDGMARRARRVLGDVGASDPRGWEAGFTGEDAHLLVTLHSDDRGRLRDAVAELRDAPGLARGRVQEASVLPDAREHFGFSDGFAQPSLRNVRYRDRQPRGNGVPLRFGRWRRLALGEFVLGYYDEDHVRPEAPPGPLGRDATYMVWRKLHQDVALFRRAMLTAADGDEAQARWLAARVVGRWDDGTPLMRSPDRPDPAIAGHPEARNDFRYGRDPGGVLCPVGAHVRRANPRDALGFGHKLSFRQRLIRRGVPYGDPLPAGVTQDDGRERGLVFVCFNASLSRQFEVVQGQWCADGRTFRLGDDPDPLLGRDDQVLKFTIQSRPPEPPRFLDLHPFVTTRGGDYFFVPGVAGLRALAGGAEADGA